MTLADIGRAIDAQQQQQRRRPTTTARTTLTPSAS
jgi:hypothetical protein